MKLTFYLILIIAFVGCDIPSSNDKSPSKEQGLIETKTPRGGKIWSLDWSPDDQFVACGNASGLLRIYSVESLELVKVLTGFKATINSIHWSPDGSKIIASGGNDDPRVILWNLIEETNLIIEAHKRQVRSVRWSPNGKYFASSSHDGSIRVWTTDGNLVKIFRDSHGGCVGIDWLNEDKIAASCWDNTIRTYSISGKDSLLIENGNHRRKAVLSVDWHPNGKYLATGDYGNEEDSINAVKIWNQNGELIKEMTSHEKEIRSLSWNADGTVLASGGETIRTWDIDGNLLKIFKENSSPVWSLDWNKKGDKLVSGHNDGKLRFWNKEGNLLKVLDGHSSEITSISFSKDSTMLFIGFSGGTLRFYDLKNINTTLTKAHSRGLRSIAWSPNEKFVALNSNEGTGSIWPIVNRKIINKPVYFANEIYAKDLSWNRDNLSVAYLNYDNIISVYSVQGELQYTVNTNSEKDNSIGWKNGKAIGVESESNSDETRNKVIVRVKNEYLTLIPLTRNTFALLNEENHEIVYGQKKDFIEIVAKANGFTRLESIQ